MGSKFSFMRSPIAILTHLADLQLNLKKETDIDFIACPAFYTICNAMGNGQQCSVSGFRMNLQNIVIDLVRRLPMAENWLRRGYYGMSLHRS